MGCFGREQVVPEAWLGHRGRQAGRGGGMPHREAELVSSSWQYMTLKSACCEHVARGLDGRVADSADLMFRSSAKNVAGMTGIWKRARESTARG